MSIPRYSGSTPRPSGSPVLAFCCSVFALDRLCLRFICTNSAGGPQRLAHGSPVVIPALPSSRWQTKASTLEALWERGHLWKPELEPELKFAWVWALAWGFGRQSLRCLAMWAWAVFWNLGCTTQARRRGCGCCPLGTQAWAWFAAKIKFKNLIVERVKWHLRCLKPKWDFLFLVLRFLFLGS